VKTPDLDKIRANTRAVLGAEPEPPPGMFDDDVPVDAYKIPPVPANVVPIRRPDGKGLESGVVGMRDAVDAALKAAYAREVRRNNGQTYLGVPCGLTKLDDAIDGWQRQRTYIIGGRSGMGKTVVGVSVAIGLAKQGEPIAYMSMEMPTTQLAMRALFAEGRVESWRWKEGRMRQPDDWNSLMAACESLKPLPWLFDETSCMTVEQLRAKVEYMQRRFKDTIGKELHSVIIDHVLLLKGTNERQPRREQVVHITKSLKAMANDLNLCVIELTQLSRAMEARSVKDKRPQISDLKESGSSEEDADAVLLLYRSDYYEKDKSQWDRELEVGIPKLRDGEPCVVKLHFDGARQRVDSLAVDSDETPEAQAASLQTSSPTSKPTRPLAVSNEPGEDDGYEVPDVQDVGPTDYLDSLLPRTDP
jgi:replicative DNA helicase